MLNKSVRSISVYNLSRKDKLDIKKFMELVHPISDFKNLYFDEFDIGYGSLSTIVSATRENELDYSEKKTFERMKNILFAAATTYRSMLNHLKSGGYDIVYLFFFYEFGMSSIFNPLEVPLRAHYHF